MIVPWLRLLEAPWRKTRVTVPPEDVPSQVMSMGSPATGANVLFKVL
jgi:hypothetical protein